MDKHQRQQSLLEVIRSRRVTSQVDLVGELEKRGAVCTQASISRDLTELGVVKVGGAYRAPDLQAGQSGLVEKLTADKAGDNLIVFRTGPGVANAAAMLIDRARIPGIVGSVAGDDTIFIAVRERADQNPVIRKVFALFKRG